MGAFFLVLLLADLLTITFASERFFDALLFARLQVEGMALDFFDNVFCLHLALKATQGIFKRFAFLNSNLCQEKHLQTFPERDTQQNTLFWRNFAGLWGFFTIRNRNCLRWVPVALVPIYHVHFQLFMDSGLMVILCGKRGRHYQILGGGYLWGMGGRRFFAFPAP